MVLISGGSGLEADAEAYLKTTTVPAALEAALDDLFQKCLEPGAKEPPSVRVLAEHLKAFAAKQRAEAAAVAEPAAAEPTAS